MTNEKLFLLIEKLLENTRSGNIKWEVTANANRFATSKADYSIIISIEGGNICLEIVDDWDEEIERINDVDLRDVDSNSLDVMKSLFVIARRNARGADKAIDDILDSLS